MRSGCRRKKGDLRGNTTLATTMDSELEESDPFADVEEHEDELEENELVLEDC